MYGCNNQLFQIRFLLLQSILYCVLTIALMFVYKKVGYNRVHYTRCKLSTEYCFIPNHLK